MNIRFLCRSLRLTYPMLSKKLGTSKQYFAVVSNYRPERIPLDVEKKMRATFQARFTELDGETDPPEVREIVRSMLWPAVPAQSGDGARLTGTPGGASVSADPPAA